MARKILFPLFFLLAILVIGYLSTHSTQDPETVIEDVEDFRSRRERFLRYSEDSPFRAQNIAFKPLQYFDIAPEFRVKARLAPFERPERVEMRLTNGKKEAYLKWGLAKFELNNEPLALTLYKPLSEDSEFTFFLPFKDATSGEASYGGGRYMDLDPETETTIWLDFNKAYNPYCVYSPSYVCPLPPPENKLAVAILAGEKNYE